MNKHYTRLLLLSCICAAAFRLTADPIPTLTATSASVASGETSGPCFLAFGCAATGSIKGNSFAISGTGYNGVSEPFIPGSTNSTSFGFTSPAGGNAPGEPQGAQPFFGTVMLAGKTIPVDYDGSVFIKAPDITLGAPAGSSIVTVSAGDITAPPLSSSSPFSTIVLPATITGGFQACPISDVIVVPYTYCAVSPAIANISVNLQGLLRVDLTGGPNLVRVRESFTTTPDPPTIFLVTSGIFGAILFRRKWKLPV